MLNKSCVGVLASGWAVKQKPDLPKAMSVACYYQLVGGFHPGINWLHL